MAEECVVIVKNLGKTKCTKLPGMIRGMIETPAGFSITPEDAVTADAWQDLLKDVVADRGYLWPFFVGYEDVSEEPVYEEGALADILVRDGKYKFRFMIKQDLCLHKAMFTHRGTGMRVFLIDDKNQIIGTED